MVIFPGFQYHQLTQNAANLMESNYESTGHFFKPT